MWLWKSISCLWVSPVLRYWWLIHSTQPREWLGAFLGLPKCLLKVAWTVGSYHCRACYFLSLYTIPFVLVTFAHGFQLPPPELNDVQQWSESMSVIMKTTSEELFFICSVLFWCTKIWGITKGFHFCLQFVGEPFHCLFFSYDNVRGIICHGGSVLSSVPSS